MQFPIKRGKVYCNVYSLRQKCLYNIVLYVSLKYYIRVKYYIAACNRTYYGEVGNSYRLSVKKQQKERPFLCHLSFTASGQEHGDFIEVSII